MYWLLLYHCWIVTIVSTMPCVISYMYVPVYVILAHTLVWWLLVGFSSSIVAMVLSTCLHLPSGSHDHSYSYIGCKCTGFCILIKYYCINEEISKIKDDIIILYVPRHNKLQSLSKSYLDRYTSHMHSRTNWK